MSHFPHIAKLGRAFIDALTGTACLGCNAPGTKLCLPCTRTIPRPHQRCIGCAVTRRDGMTCQSCTETWHVQRLLTAASYHHPLTRKAVKELKYHLNRAIARPMALRMLTALHTAPRTLHNPLFVPIPLHIRRERSRGFNQAALLAHAAADRGLFSYAEPLKRTRNTASQTKTSGRAERMDAMTRAFTVTDTATVANRHIILVDDVCTTGATLNAAADALMRAGARSITGLVIARA